MPADDPTTTKAARASVAKLFISLVIQRDPVSASENVKLKKKM